MFKKIIVALCSLVMITASANDTIKTKNVDQLQKHLQELTLLIEKNNQQRIIDSVRRVDMMSELNNLTNTDRTKREDLQKQLDEIERQTQVRLSDQKDKITKLRNSAKGYPVAPFKDTIFIVYTKLGPIRPEERAQIISEKIQLVYDDEQLNVDSIKQNASENTVDIVYGSIILMSITDWDALWFETSKEKLARSYQKAITGCIVKEKSANQVTDIILRIGSALLVILFIYLLIHFVNKLYLKTVTSITNNKDQYLRGIKLKSYHFLTPEEELNWVLKVVLFFKWLSIVLLIYLALPSIFSIFPFTKDWATTLYKWIWYPFKGIFTSFFAYLPNLITIFVIYFVVRYVIKVVRYMAYEVESGKLKITGFHADWAMPTFSIVRFLLYAFMFVVIFPYLPGSDSDVFKGVSVFLGILLSLGSSSAIANMVAGLVITYMRPFKIGDRIKIGEVSGDVLEKTILVTRIKTIKNEEITIPNSNLLTGHTINYSAAAVNSKGLIIHTTITIGYDVPWPDVHKAMLEAASRTNFLLEDPAPFILQTALNDFYVSYQLNAYTLAASKQAVIYSELHQRIQDVFKEYEIEIMSPHYQAMRNGNSSTIPK